MQKANNIFTLFKHHLGFIVIGFVIQELLLIVPKVLAGYFDTLLLTYCSPYETKCNSVPSMD